MLELNATEMEVLHSKDIIMLVVVLLIELQNIDKYLGFLQTLIMYICKKRIVYGVLWTLLCRANLMVKLLSKAKPECLVNMLSSWKECRAGIFFLRSIPATVFPVIRQSLGGFFSNPGNVDDMRYEWARYRTFEQCTIDLPLGYTHKLAAGGFFFAGNANNIRCFSCGVSHINWNEGDDPETIHRDASPNCHMTDSDGLPNMPIEQDMSDTRFSNLLMQSILDDEESIPDEENDNEVPVDESNNEQPQMVDPSIFIPENADYALECVRLSTFLGWPASHSVTPHSLAVAGFYFTGTTDVVRCFCCNGGLRQWEPGEDPWIAHARWFPNCHYLRQRKGEDFIKTYGINTNRETIAHDVAQRPRDRHTLPEVGGTQPISGVTTQSLTQNHTPDSQLSAQDHHHSNQQGIGNNSDFTQDVVNCLVNEIHKFEQQKQCKICYQNDACVVCLPCGHLVACDTCVERIEICAVCRTPIKRTQRVFFP